MHREIKLRPLLAASRGVLRFVTSSPALISAFLPFRVLIQQEGKLLLLAPDFPPQQTFDMDLSCMTGMSGILNLFHNKLHYNLYSSHNYSALTSV